MSAHPMHTPTHAPYTPRGTGGPGGAPSRSFPSLIRTALRGHENQARPPQALLHWEYMSFYDSYLRGRTDAWIREQAGTGLVSGFRRDPHACPIARGLETWPGSAAVRGRRFRPDNAAHWRRLPWFARRFIRRFDRGKYLDLRARHPAYRPGGPMRGQSLTAVDLKIEAGQIGQPVRETTVMPHEVPAPSVVPIEPAAPAPEREREAEPVGA